MEGANSVKISWEAPAFNGRFVKYHVTGGPAGEQNPSQSPIIINGLLSNTYYLISVSAESSGGIGPATTIGPIFPEASKFFSSIEASLDPTMTPSHAMQT